jgi:hypothetical protein
MIDTNGKYTDDFGLDQLKYTTNQEIDNLSSISNAMSKEKILNLITKENYNDRLYNQTQINMNIFERLRNFFLSSCFGER